MSALAGSTLPRLLYGLPEDGWMSLAEHEAIHGRAPFAGRRERRGAGSLLDGIERAGLLGRGGASFPTAQKMRAVRGARGRPIVVVNATEGEPASAKDRTLLEVVPHLVIDGGVLAARAVRADEVLVCVCESQPAALESVERALLERAEHGHDGLAVRVVVAPDGYVSGQETALVNFLNGGPAKPTFTPPMPFERGVRRRPTLVDNAETLAHLALIARHGPSWFRELGTATHPGSSLITLSGAVVHPAVYEVDLGTSLASLVDAAGGASNRLRAILMGGYAGTWIDAAAGSRLALSNEHLASHGATLGAGIVVLLSEEDCGVAETTRVARWMAEESAGQCGPCVNGLGAIAGALEQIATGAAPAQAGAKLARWAALARHRGACRHPDGAVRLIVSALDVFADEFADHARYGPCEACSRPRVLPLDRRAAELVTVG